MQSVARSSASSLELSTDSPRAGFDSAAWFKVLVVALGFFVLYRHNFERLWDKTNFINGDPNWSHSLCVPLIGLYYLFVHRDELHQTPVEPLLPTMPSARRLIITTLMAAVGLAIYFVFGTPRLLPQIEGLSLLAGVVQNLGLGLALYAGFVLALDWGLGTLLAGLTLSLAAVYPLKNDFLWDAGMIVTLFGVVLTLGGWQVMKLAWFPIIFLFCALPWPPLVYSQIASPLQVLAARVSVIILQTTGIDASYGGTKIFIPQFNAGGTRIEDRALNVAEACAGLRSLMTFISIATAVAFLSGRPLWQKLLIAASAIPIAISCNVLRVAGQGLLDLYAGRDWSEGFAHHFAGMIMLLPAFFLIMLVCWVMDHLFLEEAEETTPATVGGVV